MWDTPPLSVHLSEAVLSGRIAPLFRSHAILTPELLGIILWHSSAKVGICLSNAELGIGITFDRLFRGTNFESFGKVPPAHPFGLGAYMRPRLR